MQVHDIISSRIENGYFIYTYAVGNQVVKVEVKIEGR